MPKCLNCGKSQAKLNRGDLCKHCFVPDKMTDCNSATEILNMTDSKNDVSCVNIEGLRIPINENIDIDLTSIGQEKYKDALLCSLYSQVEFLREQLKEKDFVIRTLLENGLKETNETVISQKSDNNTEHSLSSSEVDFNVELSGIEGDNCDDVIDSFKFNSDTVSVFSESSDLMEFQPLPTPLKQISDVKLKDQLLEIRKAKHDIYLEKHQESDDADSPRLSHQWPENTVLIVGDSLLNNVDEKRLSRKFNVKVRPFSGACVGDMYCYIAPLLRKGPKYILLHIGCNDAIDKASNEILDDILKLKLFIEKELPGCIITISCPIIRTDNGIAKITMHHLRNKIEGLKISYISNANLKSSHLGKQGLHLNARGSGRLAMNFIDFMRRL